MTQEHALSLWRELAGFVGAAEATGIEVSGLDVIEFSLTLKVYVRGPRLLSCGFSWPLETLACMPAHVFGDDLSHLLQRAQREAKR